MRKSRAKNYYIELYNPHTTDAEWLSEPMNFRACQKLAKRLNKMSGFTKDSPTRFYASQEFED